MHRPMSSLALLVTAAVVWTLGCTDAYGPVEPEARQPAAGASDPSAGGEGAAGPSSSATLGPRTRVVENEDRS